MPNRFTPLLDSLNPLTEDIILNQEIWKAGEQIKTLNEMAFYAGNEHSIPNHRPIQILFFCLVAELSDQDLEECFPELFHPAKD